MTEPIDQATKAMSNTDGEDNILNKLLKEITPEEQLKTDVKMLQEVLESQDKELASLREQLTKKEELITSIRHKLYDRDTDDAILHEIGELLTGGGYPYENED